MGGSLSFPITSKAITRTGTPKVKISACEMQGYRSAMEDYKSIILDFTQQPSPPTTPTKLTTTLTFPTTSTTTPTTTSTNSTPPVFIGLFDGHCSDNAALWFSENFPKV